MLVLTGTQLSGDVQGRAVFANALTPAAHLGLPTGVFDLHPPQTDPVFGPFVLAVGKTAASPFAGPGGAISGAQAQKPQGAASPLVNPLVAVGKFHVKRQGTVAADTFIKQQFPVGADTFIKKPGGSQGLGPAVFVISQRAIPGRHCLVMARGFSDLLAALDASGGGQLKVG